MSTPVEPRPTPTRKLSDLPPPDPTIRINGPVPESHLPIGHPTRLGDYQLGKLIGAGGVGEVYRAEDTKLGRRAAVKLLKPAAAADPRCRERFLREARAAAAIKNDHVVTVYQVGEENGVPFIAMELLKGLTLDAHLMAGKPTSVPNIARLGRETADGLAAAHARGLIHRDIKPANIWLEAPTGRVKLLDFGLARPAAEAGEESITQVGYILGTPAFMSPEQARGRPLDARTDLFSLGAVLYLLCTGRRPFEGVGVTGVLTALAVDEAVHVRMLNPAIPESLADLVHRLLAKDPENRPASARDVAKELRLIERGKAPAATTMKVRAPEPEPEPEIDDEERERRRIRPKVRRRRKKHADPVALFAAALSMLVLAATIGVVGYYALREPPDPPAPTGPPPRPITIIDGKVAPDGEGKLPPKKGFPPPKE